MTRASLALWAQLVSAYAVAREAEDEAFAIYDAIPLPDNDVSDPSPEEQRWQALNDAAEKIADKILGVVAPSPAAAALQLRLFAERYHSTDVANPAKPGEGQPEGAMLRRIYEALNATGAP